MPLSLRKRFRYQLVVSFRYDSSALTSMNAPKYVNFPQHR